MPDDKSDLSGRLQPLICIQQWRARRQDGLRNGSTVSSGFISSVAKFNNQLEPAAIIGPTETMTTRWPARGPGHEVPARAVHRESCVDPVDDRRGLARALGLYSAWIRATCPDSQHRDGRLAVASATRACELTNWKDTDALILLAAAFAEAGDFAEAVKWQQNVVSLTANQSTADALRDRLALYRCRTERSE